MPATPSQVLSGMKTRLSTISGLRAFDYQPDYVNPPFAFAQINSINYHGAFQGGNVVYDISIFAIVGRVSERTAQTQLDGYLAYSGATSIRGAIEADGTLGGVVQDTVVSRSTSIRQLSIGEAEFVQIEITAEVHG